MANSANYLLSKMSINMTLLEESVKDLQNSIKLQIKPVKKVAVPKERKYKIEPMKERLMENLHMHLADADAELARVHRLRNTLPTPENMPKLMEIISWRNNLYFNYYLERWVPTWAPLPIRSTNVYKNHDQH